MRAFATHSGRVVPLRRSDVDTDQIIPSDWLKRVERTGFGAGLFAEWRADPAFVLNDPRRAGATVLVAGPNFGTGSSREHAVWALDDYGFRVVVSSRFADIFRANCLKVGLLPVELPEPVVARLLDAADADPAVTVSVDLGERRLRCPAAGVDEPFGLDDFTRWRLVEGLDDIGLTLRHEAAITAYERARPAWKPRRAGMIGGMDDELFVSLSRRLREAHQRVAGLDAPPEVKGRVTRRLIAITDASKHDLGRAAARLDALLADLDAGRLPDADEG